MKRKTKARVLLIYGIGLLLSLVLCCVVMIGFGLIVRENDLRGGILKTLFCLSLLPGCLLYTLFVQRKLRMKGLICGTICGLILSGSFCLCTSILLQFQVTPFILLLFPAGILFSALIGIAAANFFGN